MTSTINLKSYFMLSAEYQYQGIHSGILTVYFRTGGIRAYHGISVELWNRLRSDESPSKVYVNEIKGKFPVVPIRQTPSKKPKVGGQFKIF